MLRHLLISFRFTMMIEATKLYIFCISLNDLDLHSKSQLYEKQKKCWCPFSRKFKHRFGWNSACCHNLLVCWSLCQIHFAQVIFKGEKSADVTLWKLCLISSCVRTLVNWFVWNLVFCQTLLNSTVWFQFEWSWCSLMLTGLRESENLCSHSVVKLHEAAQIFMMVYYVRETTVKMLCKSG